MSSERKKNALSFPVTPLNLDPSLLNTTAFAGVSQPDLEMELADIADKQIWVSKFKRFTADHEDVARQKAVPAQNHKRRDIESLPKPDKLVFETWNAIPGIYGIMKNYALGVLSIFRTTYVCEQVFCNMNFIKSKHRARLRDDSLQSCVKMKVTAYSPDVQTLCAEVQEQKSHQPSMINMLISYYFAYIHVFSLFSKIVILLFRLTADCTCQ